LGGTDVWGRCPGGKCRDTYVISLQLDVPGTIDSVTEAVIHHIFTAPRSLIRPLMLLLLVVHGGDDGRNKSNSNRLRSESRIPSRGMLRADGSSVRPRPLRGKCVICVLIRIYKSLFTENSVATQKDSSASINTNKIQYKIQRSSPS